MAKINEIDITSLTFQEGSAPTTPASTKWKIYTKTDGLYVIDDAGTETGPFGAGGSTVPGWISYLAARQTGETSHADDDFFDDGALAGTAVTGAGNATWVEKYGKMSVLVDTQGSFAQEVAARVFSLTPSASPVTLETRVSMTAINSAGIPAIMVGFSDGATTGANIAAFYSYLSATGIRRFYDYAGTFAAASGATLWTNQMPWTPALYVRAVWTAANTFEYSVSHDGVQFTALGQAAHSRTLTPTHFFVGAGSGSSTVPLPVSFDYVRINTTDLSP